MEPKQRSKDKIVRVGPTCSGPTCPLCTRQGFLLFWGGMSLMVLLPRQYNLLGLVPVLLAYALGLSGKLK
ncbi:hypothetical protein ACFLRF_01700 [Candidatus Altiarchaeota archaeon]